MGDEDALEVTEHRARILLTSYLGALRTCFAEAELERVIGGRACVRVDTFFFFFFFFFLSLL
jgi:hypothetical protein